MSSSVVWQGTPSQVVNSGSFLFVIISVLLYICNVSYISIESLFVTWISYSLIIVSLAMALWNYLVAKNVAFKFTNEVLISEHGVINKYIDNIELYKVKDVYIQRPFFLRLFNLENVFLITSDETHPIISIDAVDVSENLCQKIRSIVEKQRSIKGVRELNMN